MPENVENNGLSVVIKFLIDSKIIRKQQNFCEDTGINKSVISNLINGKKTVTPYYFNKMLNAFKILEGRIELKDGIIHCEGLSNYIPTNDKTRHQKLSGEVEEGNFSMTTPLVEYSAHAGFLSGYGDPMYEGELPKLTWMLDRSYHGKYYSFRVIGDSMDDGMKHCYEQGCVVLAHEVYKQYWLSKLHYDQWDAFVIVHNTEGIIIKQIVAHDVEKGIIRLHSFNPIYPDFDVNLKDVSLLFNVVGKQALKSNKSY